MVCCSSFVVEFCEELKNARNAKKQFDEGPEPLFGVPLFRRIEHNSFKKASKAYGTIYYTNRRYKELFSVLFFLWVPPPYLFFGPISPGLGKSTVLWTLSPRGVRVHFVKKNRIADQKSKDNLLPVLPFLYLFTEKTRKQRSVGPLTGFDLRRRALYRSTSWHFLYSTSMCRPKGRQV